MHRAARLLILDARGQRFVEIRKPRFTIGRHRDADLELTTADVSRMHAEIVAQDDGYVLLDAKSRYGTYVNGERTTRRTLSHGDQIRLGQTRDVSIVFQLHPVDVDDESTGRVILTPGSGVRHVAALLQSLRALGSGRVVDDVLALVLDAGLELTGAERGFVMLANHLKQLDFKLARARGNVTLAGQTFATSRKIPETVFATGEPAIVQDLADDDVRAQHPGTADLGIRHVLCIPLRVVRHYVDRADRGAPEPIGVLYLDSRERGNLYSASTLAALDVLSAEAALAIENARLNREVRDKEKVEHELAMAASIQQALLPSANHDGQFYRAAGVSVPCRAVGGDFYDYIDLPDDRFGFIVGDVAGKGPPAALLATAALGMFSAEAGYQTSTAALMARLNTRLVRRAIEARYLTSFYGILASNGDFLYSNAGHNPPLLASRTGIRRLTTGGPVLGLFDRVSFDEELVTLERGDVMVVFSDGLTEALNEDGEEYTDDRLIEFVDRHRGDSPQALLAALLADLRAFCGEAMPYDDVTIVAMRYGI